MKRLPPLNALRAFSITAQTGSFTKAGEAMHVTQGAISRQIKQLEESIGQSLFVRSHHVNHLTPAGLELAASLESVFDQMEKAVERASKSVQRQLLSVNIPPTFATRWLAPRLSDFRARYPLIDLSITTDWIHSVRDARTHDCLVVYDRAPWPKTECERIMLEHHVMVSSPDLWHKELPPSLKQSTLLHILSGEERLPVWEQWIEAHGLTYLDPKPGLNFSTLDQAINAAVAGAGVVIVDKTMIVKELKSGSLRQLNQQHLNGPYGYWFIDVAHNAERRQLVSLFHAWLLEQTQLAERLDSE